MKEWYLAGDSIVKRHQTLEGQQSTVTDGLILAVEE